MQTSKAFNLYLLTICLIIFSAWQPADENIKVACVGDSITYGSGIESRDVNSYPAQVSQILEEGWEIKNFGVSGATMLKQGDKPYWNQDEYQEALAWQPDAVVIMLGTNDSKTHNWEHKEQFADDYKALIKNFQALDSQPKIWICLPVPAFEERWGISPAVVYQEILPILKTVAKDTGAEIIDLFKPMMQRVELFPDKIHPNADGAKVMAKNVAKVLKKNRKNL